MSSSQPAPAVASLTIPLQEAVHSALPEVLIAAASDAGLSEDLALTLLHHPDVPGEAIERLAKNGTAIKSRKVKLAIVQHPKAPRHVSIPTVRHLFTFDLMQIALTPVVPADIKAVADETLIRRLESITLGERFSLAHRASGRVAAELLRDAESRIIHAALDNQRLTESEVVKALLRADSPPTLAQNVSQHSKWALRREVRIALLRNPHTPRPCLLEIVRSLPAPLVRDILHGSHLPKEAKEYLQEILERD